MDSVDPVTEIMLSSVFLPLFFHYAHLFKVSVISVSRKGPGASNLLNEPISLRFFFRFRLNVKLDDLFDLGYLDGLTGYTDVERGRASPPGSPR